MTLKSYCDSAELWPQIVQRVILQQQWAWMHQLKILVSRLLVSHSCQRLRMYLGLVRSTQLTGRDYLVCLLHMSLGCLTKILWLLSFCEILQMWFSSEVSRPGYLCCVLVVSWTVVLNCCNWLQGPDIYHLLFKSVMQTWLRLNLSPQQRSKTIHSNSDDSFTVIQKLVRLAPVKCLLLSSS